MILFYGFSQLGFVIEMAEFALKAKISAFLSQVSISIFLEI
jgi:hypothetical protein